MTSSLFGQLDIGKRSLMAQQAGMGVAGHNVANINNEKFSRQRVELEDQHPRHSRFGAGVDVDGVGRITDRFTNRRLIGEQARMGNLDTREKVLTRLEQIFNETEGNGLRATLNEFWAAWGDVANQPESEIFRSELITKSKLLSRRFGEMALDLDNLRTDLNARVGRKIEEVNQLAEQLAKQNRLVQQVDRGKGQANDVRDEREATLKALSRILQIEWFEDDANLIQVTAGNGWPLVAGRRANRLEASLKNEELGMFSIRGIDPQGISRDITDEIRNGELRELVDLRDKTVVGFMDRLDELAAEIAFKVNRHHATGTGINARHDRLRSSYALKADALNRPLPFLKSGLFRIHMVSEENDVLETYEVELRGGEDSVADVVNRINATVGEEKLFQASVNADGSVTLESTGPYQFIFGEDETDFAVLMGFNNFLETLQGASDLQINERLVREPNSISAGQGLVPGDNTVALAIHALQFEPTMAENSITFDEFYNGMIAELGLFVQRSQTEKRNQEVIVDQFQKLRDEVSSVSMDEEVADMVQYQRGFDASARFITTVDQMTQTVIDM